MKVPNLTKQLNSKVIDDKIYIDLEGLLETMFSICTEANIVATKTLDPSLGVMTQGMVHMCRALEAVLAAKQDESGLPVTGQPLKP